MRQRKSTANRTTLDWAGTRLEARSGRGQGSGAAEALPVGHWTDDAPTGARTAQRTPPVQRSVDNSTACMFRWPSQVV